MGLTALVLLSLIPTSLASYCGQATVPFTFQVLRAGYPVIGCARPRCFGWTANGTRVPDSAQFYRINGKDDGYLRRSDVLLRQPYKQEGFVPQVSTCESAYRQNGCDAGQWVGGLAPQSDPYSNTLQIRCCSYGSLFNSEDRGIATLHPGQMVAGGEITKDNRLVAFDYIANLNKIIAENGTVIYNVHIRRMSCFDDDNLNNPETITSQNSIIRQSQQQLPANPLDVAPADIALQTVQDQQPRVQEAAPTVNFQGQAPGFQQQAPQPMQLAPQQFQAQNQLPQQMQQMPQQWQQQPQQQNFQQSQQAAQQQGFMQQQNGQQVQVGQQQGIQQLNLQQQNQQNGLFPMANLFPQQPQQQMINGMPALPTLPPIKLPTLEDIPKIDIPSVEDVEQSIPPVQRAILTSVARFFGVL